MPFRFIPGRRNSESIALNAKNWLAITLAVLLLLSFVPLSYSGQPWPIIPSASAALATVNVSDTPDSISANARLATDGDDNLYVIWEESLSTDVFVSKSIDGGENFGEAVNISNTSEITSWNARIAVDSDNNVYAVWQEGFPGEILLSKSTDGGMSFSEPVNISETADTDSANPKLTVAGDSVLLVLWEDDADIHISKSIDGGNSFESANISDNEGLSFAPQMAASADGSKVFVVWQDNSPGNFRIMFRNSTDGGDTFEPSAIILGNDSSFATTPQIATTDDGSTIVLVWRDLNANEIYFTKSADSGATFDEPANLSQDGSSPSLTPQVAISSDAVLIFIAWEGLESENDEILFAKSTDGGENFDDIINISRTANGFSEEPQMALSQDESLLFVVWRDDAFENTGIYISKSTNSGNSFSQAVRLSSGNQGEEPASTPRLLISGNNSLTVAWQSTEGIADVFVKAEIDVVEPVITLAPIADSTPRWGVDSVTVNGTAVNYADEDSVTVDWGDGSSTTNIPIAGGVWTSTRQPFDASAVGTLEINATLVDSEGNPRAGSDPLEIAVLPHSTILTLDQINSVIQGGDVSVTGSLSDADAGGVGIQAKLVSFDDGSGNNVSLTSSITDANGQFASTMSAGDVAQGQLVQAHFGGDSAYLSSNSTLRAFDVVSNNSQQYQVDAGVGQFVNLTDHGASITFDDASSGSVFVSHCVAPASDRYAPLDGLCLDISSAVPMEPGTGATVQVSFAGKTIPEGFAANDISLFHKESTTGLIVDITESVDVINSTVTGRTSEFSDFIVGAAIHDEQPPRVVRARLFVGDNEVGFRDISDHSNQSSVVMLDKSSYKRGDVANVTIIDIDSNIDPLLRDVVTAEVSSNSSDPEFITITLTETGADSGVFYGTFVVSTSTTGDRLEVNSDDQIFLSYIPHNARAAVVFERVSEAGLVDIGDYLQDDEIVPFQPVSSAIHIKLIDAQLDTDGKIRVTLSYANTLIGHQDPAFFRMYHKDPNGGWPDVTMEDPQGHDLDAMTVTGETTTEGVFVLGIESGEPGGSGGGLARPGGGLVVDFVASIARGGGGGGDGSRSASSGATSESSPRSILVPSGEGVKSSFDVDGIDRNLELIFDEVDVSGVVTVRQLTPSGTSSIFESIQSTGSGSSQGVLTIDGSQATTVGSIYNVTTPSEMNFTGVLASLPYDETAVKELGSSEAAVRFLHYDGDSWEDLTIDIDIESNTVIGLLTSLSPIAVGVISDGTFGSLYLEANPLSTISISSAAYSVAPAADDSQLLQITLGDTVDIKATLENQNRSSQSYAYVVQIVDSNGHVVFLDWIEGELVKSQIREIAIGWTPIDTGDYQATIIVLDGNPIETQPLGVIAAKVSLGTIGVD